MPDWRVLVVGLLLVASGCLGGDPKLATGGDPTAPLTAMGTDTTIAEGTIYSPSQYFANLSAGDVVVLTINVNRGGPPVIVMSPLADSGASKKRIGGDGPFKYTVTETGLYHIQIANIERAYIAVTVE
ncbi:MAG: hypothetical protein SVG88_03590 [Halobacteriales archaeon]|nr:hypothetical protein [Halobacteriales archaeon]